MGERPDVIQLIESEILLYRAKERLGGATNPIGEETKVLFDFIMMKIREKVEMALPAKNRYQVIGQTSKKGRFTYLEIEGTKYIPMYVAESDFTKVLENVARIYNGLRGYRGEISPLEDSQEIVVSMEV